MLYAEIRNQLKEQLGLNVIQMFDKWKIEDVAFDKRETFGDIVYFLSRKAYRDKVDGVESLIERYFIITDNGILEVPENIILFDYIVEKGVYYDIKYIVGKVRYWNAVIIFDFGNLKEE